MPIPPDRYDPNAPEQWVADAREYIGAARWRFARTMANIPHWYVQRKHGHAAGLGSKHERLYLLIKNYGYDRSWYRRTFRSVDLDGWVIWMLTDGTFLNTAPLGEAFEPVPTCHVHGGETMWLDEGRPYRQWHCPECDRAATTR